jgi:hypothetical protein
MKNKIMAQSLDPNFWSVIRDMMRSEKETLSSILNEYNSKTVVTTKEKEIAEAAATSYKKIHSLQQQLFLIQEFVESN